MAASYPTFLPTKFVIRDRLKQYDEFSGGLGMPSSKPKVDEFDDFVSTLPPIRRPKRANNRTMRLPEEFTGELEDTAPPTQPELEAFDTFAQGLQIKQPEPERPDLAEFDQLAKGLQIKRQEPEPERSDLGDFDSFASSLPSFSIKGGQPRGMTESPSDVARAGGDPLGGLGRGAGDLLQGATAGIQQGAVSLGTEALALGLSPEYREQAVRGMLPKPREWDLSSGSPEGLREPEPVPPPPPRRPGQLGSLPGEAAGAVSFPPTMDPEMQQRTAEASRAAASGVLQGGLGALETYERARGPQAELQYGAVLEGAAPFKINPLEAAVQGLVRRGAQQIVEPETAAGWDELGQRFEQRQMPEAVREILKSGVPSELVLGVLEPKHLKEGLQLLREAGPDAAAAYFRTAQKVPIGLGVKQVGEEAAPKRYYHGTGSAFDAPDAAKFDPNGLYGPGYYLTDNPEVAGSYAGSEVSKIQSHINKLQALKTQGVKEGEGIPSWSDSGYTQTMPIDIAIKETTQYFNNLTTRPNTRAIDVPQDLKLFDVDEIASTDLIDFLRKNVGGPAYKASFDGVLERAARFGEITNETLYDALQKTITGKYANSILKGLGYDGIRYGGGKRIPMKDAVGNPIEHEALVIFPESLPKIRNAISGTPMGMAPETVGGAIGGAYGYATSDEDERLERTLQGVALGAVGGNLARPGSKVRMGLSVEGVGKGPLGQYQRVVDERARDILGRIPEGARLNPKLGSKEVERYTGELWGLLERSATDPDVMTPERVDQVLNQLASRRAYELRERQLGAPTRYPMPGTEEAGRQWLGSATGDIRPETVLREASEGYVPGVGRATQAVGPDPTKSYDFRYRVVDLDELVPSHTDTMAINPGFPKELQPRLRERAASQVQIDRIARELVPDALLSDAGRLDAGPMIIGADNVVESGNGRILALRRARAEYPENFQRYQQELRQRLGEYGIDPESVQSIRNPVLVRERLSDVDRARFAAEANEAATLTMSPLEQALQDTGRIGDDALAALEIGENQGIDAALKSTANRDFVRSFMTQIPGNERAALVGASGELNPSGLVRLKSALFAKVYPGEAGRRLTASFTESLDPGVKNIEAGMFGSLPAMARAEGLIRAGMRDEGLSIAEDVSKAVDMLARLREEGIPVSHYFSQQAMWDRELTPTQERLLQWLSEVGRSPKKVREALSEYAAQVEAAPDPRQMGMFGGEAVSKEDILERVIQRQAQREADNAPLFATRPEAEPGASIEASQSATTQAEGPRLDVEPPSAQRGIGPEAAPVIQRPPATTQPVAGPPQAPRRPRTEPEAKPPTLEEIAALGQGRLLPDDQVESVRPPRKTEEGAEAGVEIGQGLVGQPRLTGLNAGLAQPPPRPPRAPTPPRDGPLGTSGPPIRPDSWLPTVKSNDEILQMAYRPDWPRRLADWAQSSPTVRRLIPGLRIEDVSRAPERGLNIALGKAAEVIGIPSRTLAGQGRILHQTIQVDWNSGSSGTMARLRSQGSSKDLFGVKDNIATLSDGTRGAINDVAEHPTAYRLTPEQRRWIDTLHRIEDDMGAALAVEGIDIRKLQFEEGGHWVGRRVMGKVDTEGNVELARIVSETRKKGIASKAPFEKAREYATQAEALADGFRYLSPEETLQANLQAAGRKIADKRVTDFILENMAHRTAAAPAEIRVAREHAFNRFRAIVKLQQGINRAYRGERLPNGMIAGIGRYFPDEARELLRLGPENPGLQRLEARIPELKDAAKTAYMEADRALSKALERARRPKYGEGTVATSTLQGKFFSAEDAKEIRKILDLEPKSRLRSTAELVAAANALPRLILTTFDLGGPVIQLQMLAFYDQKVWVKTVGRSLQALVSEKGYEAFKATHAETIRKWAPNGAIFTPSEFTEAARPGRLTARIPLVKRFARSFDAALNAARIYGLEATEYMARTPAQKRDLAAFWNEMTGVVSTARMGISPTQQAVETAVMFAPRYRRAVLGLMVDVARGGLRGQMAREAIGKTVVGGLAAYVGVSYVLGQEPHLDPREGGKFLTVEIAGQRIGMGGAFYGTSRALLQMALQPDKAPEIAQRYVRGMSSPFVSSGIDILTREDYAGRPLDTPLKLTKEVVGGNLTPIWAQSWLLEGMEGEQAAVTSLAEFAGARTFPVSPAEKRDTAMEKAAQRVYGKPAKDLEPDQWDALQREAPEVARLRQEATEKYAEQGSPYHQYRLTVDGLRDKKESQIKALGDQLNAGSISGNEYRELVTERERDIALLPDVVKASNPRFSEALQEIEKGTAEDREQGPLAQFLDQYYEIAKSLSDSRTGTLDVEQLVTEREALKKRSDPEIVNRAMAYVNRNRAPEYVKALGEFRQMMAIPKYLGLSEAETRKADEISRYIRATRERSGSGAMAEAEAIDKYGDDYLTYWVAKKQGTNPERKFFRMEHPLIAKYFSDVPMVVEAPSKSATTRKQQGSNFFDDYPNVVGQ